jgi:hypothetical protein
MRIKKITPKLKTKKDIKISLAAHYAKRQTILVHNSTRASHNSYSVANIEQIKLIYKFLKTYATDI